jgi:ferredoxin
MSDVTITLLPQDWRFDAKPDDTLLQAAERAGIAMPNSCRNGTCRTCLCRLTAGRVRYLVEWPGLSIEEKREGWTLPCVAVAQEDCTLEQPVAKRSARPAQAAHN